MNQNKSQDHYNLPPLRGEQAFIDQADPVRDFKFPNPSDEKENPIDAASSNIKELTRAFDSAIISAHDLSNLRITPREPILGSWFKQGCARARRE